MRTDTSRNEYRPATCYSRGIVREWTRVNSCRKFRELVFWIERILDSTQQVHGNIRLRRRKVGSVKNDSVSRASNEWRIPERAHGVDQLRWQNRKLLDHR